MATSEEQEWVLAEPKISSDEALWVLGSAQGVLEFAGVTDLSDKSANMASKLLAAGLI